MPKVQGFKIKVELFLPIDKSDFGKQAAAYAMMDAIDKTKKIPAELIQSCHVISVDAKPAKGDVPDAPPATDQDKNDPALTPLTTDPLPDGAEIIEATTALDGSIFQTIRLVDGTEAFRRISADQDAAEVAAAEASGKPKRKGK